MTIDDCEDDTDKNFRVLKLRSFIKKFKKLRRQLQRKHHIKIEFCVKWSVLRLFHVGRLVQNRRRALSLAWQVWFSCKCKEWKIYCCELALSSEPHIGKFYFVARQTTSKNCTNKRAARAARSFFFVQPIKSLICGVVVDVITITTQFDLFSHEK